jgi:hypothetical protein
MKQLARKLLLIGALVTASSSASAFFDGLDCMSPYVGIDYQQRWVRHRNNDDGLDGNNRHRSFPGFNAYLGGRWDCFGLEVGGHYAANRRNGRTASIAGGYLDLVGYLPAMDCLELMGTVGIGYDSARISTLNFGSRTANGVVGRIRIGANYMFSECIGIRGLVGWESTSTLRRRNNNDGFNHRLGDSFLASLGVFFKF